MLLCIKVMSLSRGLFVKVCILVIGYTCRPTEALQETFNNTSPTIPVHLECKEGILYISHIDAKACQTFSSGNTLCLDRNKARPEVMESCSFKKRCSTEITLRQTGDSNPSYELTVFYLCVHVVEQIFTSKQSDVAVDLFCPPLDQIYIVDIQGSQCEQGWESGRCPCNTTTKETCESRQGYCSMNIELTCRQNEEKNYSVKISYFCKYVNKTTQIGNPITVSLSCPDKHFMTNISGYGKKCFISNHTVIQCKECLSVNVDRKVLGDQYFDSSTSLNSCGELNTEASDSSYVNYTYNCNLDESTLLMCSNYFVTTLGKSRTIRLIPGNISEEDTNCQCVIAGLHQINVSVIDQKNDEYLNITSIETELLYSNESNMVVDTLPTSNTTTIYFKKMQTGISDTIVEIHSTNYETSDLRIECQRSTSNTSPLTTTVSTIITEITPGDVENATTEMTMLKSSTGAVIGGSLGGVVFIILCVISAVLLFLFIQKRRRQKDNSANQEVGPNLDTTYSYASGAEMITENNPDQIEAYVYADELGKRKPNGELHDAYDDVRYEEGHRGQEAMTPSGENYVYDQALQAFADGEETLMEDNKLYDSAGNFVKS